MQSDQKPQFDRIENDRPDQLDRTYFGFDYQIDHAIDRSDQNRCYC